MNTGFQADCVKLSLSPMIPGFNAKKRIRARKSSNCCYPVLMPKSAYRIKRYKHPRLKFVVRTKINGMWERKFFRTKGEAETYVQLRETELLNQGKEGVAFPSWLRIMAEREHERLRPFEKTLTNAVDFYVAHLQSMQKSAPVPQAIQEVTWQQSRGGRQRTCQRRAGRAQSHAERKRSNKPTTPLVGSGPQGRRAPRSGVWDRSRATKPLVAAECRIGAR
jgi:hypothetical protein